jgi:hypothetical protein
MTDMPLRPCSFRQASRPVPTVAQALRGAADQPSGVIVAPLQSVVCPAPLLANQPRNARLFFPRAGVSQASYSLPITATRIDVVANADVIGPRFVVRASTGHVFEETYWNSTHLSEPPFRAAVPTAVVPWVAAHETAPSAADAVLLGTPWTHNYHHWLINSLGRLAVIDRIPELRQLPLVVPGTLNAWQHESLLALGVEPSRLLHHAADVLHCERLVIPTGGDFAPTSLAWLRDRAVQSGLPVDRGGKRLYISRADAQQRRVVNEDEIRAALSQRGFEVMVPSQTRFREQVSRCAAAKWIVGPHGAGLTNAVFAAAEATVIEFHPADEMNHVFWLQASACGQRYGMVSGEVVNHHRDQHVPLPALLELLDRCGCTAE